MIFFLLFRIVYDNSSNKLELQSGVIISRLKVGLDSVIVFSEILIYMVLIHLMVAHFYAL